MNVEPWRLKANPKGLGSLPVPWSGYATAIILFFLLIYSPENTQTTTKM